MAGDEQRAVTEKICVGPWTISATRARDGTLSIEALLGDVPRAKIELEEGRRPGNPARSKLDADMDF